ncbi:MAG: pirin family protein [Polyangiaceae bacterium]|nr:pirin family protein [Polyangiaceae bacterium]
MITIRRAEDRGHADHGWLDTRHTFSFADYYDPAHMGFRTLRVINDDRVVAGAGFGTHPHRDMEILSYVLEGALEHKDSMGHGAVLHYGDIQHMSAGSGVRHSEFNSSKTDPLHFLQIWIMPTKLGIKPGYSEKTFSESEKRGKLRLIASPDGTDGSFAINASACVHATLLEKGERIEYVVPPGRHAWIHVATGDARVDGQDLHAGDGASTSDAGPLAIEGASRVEVLVFDLS